jgi:hypothetical protein
MPLGVHNATTGTNTNSETNGSTPTPGRFISRSVPCLMVGLTIVPKC